LLGRGRTAEVYAWNDKALKLFVDGFPAEWIRAEAEATRVAHRAGLSAPAVGEIVEVDGRIGIVYERIDGVSMLQTFATRPWTFLSAVRRFVEFQVAMHNCAGSELSSQRERLENAIQRAPRLAVEMKEQVLQGLDRLPDGDAICHGDYHPDNIIMSSQGLVVIDWMTATRGNPLADVARTSLMCRVSAAPPGASGLVRWAMRLGQGAFHALYLREYSARQPFDREQLEAWTPAMAAARLVEGISDEEDRLVALVEASVGEQN
jgi:tRNA A-37 threonylcarbamoyl transferase component Bud32